MSTKDPFLNSLIVWRDRLTVWLWLSAVGTALLWSVVWHTYLGFPDGDVFPQFVRFVTWKADTVSTTIGVLIVCLAIQSVNVVSLWLFAKWRRKGELSAEHIRGSKLKD